MRVQARRPLLLAVGFAMLALGFAGTVLPVLPATPFFLAAAWSFSRSSPRMERWLYRLPIMGQGLHLWQQHGAIGTRAKVMALAALGLSALLLGLLRTTPDFVTWPALALMMAVALFIATRPGPPIRKCPDAPRRRPR